MVLDEITLKEDGAGCYLYSGMNPFNSMHIGEAVLIPNSRTLLLSSDDDFVAAWERHCAANGGESLTARARQLDL